jgi:exodeoxyribonuclease VII small subunit
MPETPEDKASAPGFETCLAELERTVKELESGDLPLERALELYEKGVALAESCRKQLEEAETRVEILMKREGRIQPEPFRPDRS